MTDRPSRTTTRVVPSSASTVASSTWRRYSNKRRFVLVVAAALVVCGISVSFSTSSLEGDGNASGSGGSSTADGYYVEATGGIDHDYPGNNVVQAVASQTPPSPGSGEMMITQPLWPKTRREETAVVKARADNDDNNNKQRPLPKKKKKKKGEKTTTNKADNNNKKQKSKKNTKNKKSTKKKKKKKRRLQARNTTMKYLGIPWPEVKYLYGREPVILGMETCERYRRSLINATTSSMEPMPRIAGMWNTGTNNFAKSLDINYKKWHRPKDTKKMYQVPWGKHASAKYRSTLLDAENPESNKTQYVLPIVLVKDPFWWMASMCKIGYAAKWERDPSHCPNLLRNNGNNNSHDDTTAESKKKTRTKATISPTYNVTVTVGEHANNNGTASIMVDHYESLATLWSQWIRDYLDAPYPRLLVRFEDTLFYPSKVMDRIKECVSGNRTDSNRQKLLQPYRYYAPPSKVHGKSSDLLTAIAKYGREHGRYNCLTVEELEYTRTGALDPELMRLLRYRHAPRSFVPNASAPCAKHFQAIEREEKAKG